MVKSADSGQIAKAREQIEERAQKAFDAAYISDTDDPFSGEQMIEFAAAFAASERQAVIEDCCRAVCVYCAGEDLFGLKVQPATINGGNTSGLWVHLTGREDIKAACDAAAIRSME